MNEIYIKSYLKTEMIFDVDKIKKEAALEFLIDKMSADKNIKDAKRFRLAIFARESLMSTGIGHGIAIPHTRLDCIEDFVISILRCSAGIEYDAIDNKPVKLVIMIAANDNQANQYLHLISKLMVILKDNNTLEKICSVNSTTEIYNIIMNEKME
jgi:fructose-specific phosphotransferase system IIA component